MIRYVGVTGAIPKFKALLCAKQILSGSLQGDLTLLVFCVNGAKPENKLRSMNKGI